VKWTSNFGGKETYHSLVVKSTNMTLPAVSAVSVPLGTKFFFLSKVTAWDIDQLRSGDKHRSLHRDRLPQHIMHKL
jgi:hypothetical protein